jgi:Rieske Fe-S protein
MAGSADARRAFLKQAGCAGISLLCLGLGAADATTLPITVLSAAGGQSGDERRYPIPSSDGVTVDRSAQLIVVRSQGHVYVFALSCPHQNNAVKWNAKNNRFQCTKHDSQYQADGVYTTGRATRNLDRYVIRRDGDTVVVDLRHWVQSDKDPAQWAAASIAV